MTVTKLFASAAIAALPFTAIAADPFSPFIEITGGERAIEFVDQPSSRSRAEAYSESAQHGARVVVGERGLVFDAPRSTRSRAEVLAELREAQRLGLLANGEAGAPIATSEQLAQVAEAGDAAAALRVSAARN